jgi:hypothetical protein
LLYMPQVFDVNRGNRVHSNDFQMQRLQDAPLQEGSEQPQHWKKLELC